MRIMLAAGLLGCAAAIAVTAEAQPRGHGSSTHPSIEGNWRVNFILPMEATPATPQLAPGYGFGLGFAIRRADGLNGTLGSAGEYTWGGAGGTAFGSIRRNN